MVGIVFLAPHATHIPNTPIQRYRGSPPPPPVSMAKTIVRVCEEIKDEIHEWYKVGGVEKTI
jgi:hypothetical protein